MALFEDMFKGGGASGLAVGLGVALLGPILIPTIARVVRPAAKTMVKAGISVYRQAAEGFSEATTGLVEEAREELAHEMATSATGAGEQENGHRGRGRSGRRH